MPAQLTQDDAGSHMLNVMSSGFYGAVPALMRAELGQFEYRRPAEVGPVPLMEALQAYVAGQLASRDDPELVARLRRAAEQGTWLARSWLFAELARRQRSAMTTQRMAQLAYWMIEKEIGDIYVIAYETTISQYAFAEKSHPPDPSKVDVLAAACNSYRAQYVIGQQLMKFGDLCHIVLGGTIIGRAS